MRFTTGSTPDPFNPAVRPPLADLPDKLAALAKELDSLTARRNLAQSRLMDQQHWADEHARARRADARDAVQAIRENREHSSATAHVDAVDVEREKVRTEVDNLSAAIDVVRGELGSARNDEWDDNKAAHLKRLDAQRAKLAKLGDQIRATVAEAVPVLAMAEWLSGQGAYNTSANMRLTDVASGNTALGPSATGATLSTEQLATAIASIVGTSEDGR